jgi:hypothetical protein
VHVIAHQMIFFDPTFLLHREAPKNLAQIPSQLRVQCSRPTLRNEHNLIFARALGVVQASVRFRPEVNAQDPANIPIDLDVES